MKKIKTALINGTLEISQIPAVLTGKNPTKLSGFEIGNTSGKIAFLEGGTTLPLSLFPTDLVGKNASSVNGKTIGDGVGQIPKVQGSSKLTESIYNYQHDNHIIINCTIDLTVTTNTPVYYNGSYWTKSKEYKIDGIYIGNNKVALNKQKIPKITTDDKLYLTAEGDLVNSINKPSNSIQIGYLINANEFMIDIKRQNRNIQAYYQRVTASNGSATHAFGWSVAYYRNIAVVSATGITTNTGAVYVFRYNGSMWVQEQILTASDSATGDYFGWAVAIYNNLIIIGADQKTVGGYTTQGKAYIFRYNGTTWVQEQILTASNGTASDRFGTSVAINDNVAVVSAYYKNVYGLASVGCVYVFRYINSTWVEEQILISSNYAASDYFGISMSMHNNVIVVGARNKTVGANATQGCAYVFRYSGTAWIQEQILTSTNGAAGDLFGNAVFVYNNVIIIGAYAKNNGSANQGSVYMFRYINGSWIQEQILTAYDTAASDAFGSAVCMNDNILLISAFSKTIVGASQGCAYVYKYINNMWIYDQTIISPDGVANDYFGRSVYLYDEYAVLGAYNKTIGSNATQGATYFYSLF